MMNLDDNAQNVKKLYLKEFFSVFKSKHKDKDKSALSEKIDASIASCRNSKADSYSESIQPLFPSKALETSESQTFTLTQLLPDKSNTSVTTTNVSPVMASSPPNQSIETKAKEPISTPLKTNKKSEPVERNASKMNNVKEVLEMKSNERKNELIFLGTVIWLGFMLTGFVKDMFHFLFRIVLYWMGQLDPNERLFLQFRHTWIIIQVLITCLLFSLVSHRLITGMLRIYIRLYLSKSLSNNGKFDIHIDWVSYRGILDKNQIIVHNLVWRNPPTHTNTPFLLRIKELTISFEFLQCLSFHRSGRLKAIKFDEIMIDSVEIYFERATTSQSANSLNVWAAMGIIDKNAEKTMLRSIVKSIMTAIKRRMKQNFTMGLSKAAPTTESDDEAEDITPTTATTINTATAAATASVTTTETFDGNRSTSADSNSDCNGNTNTMNSHTVDTLTTSSSPSSSSSSSTTTTTVTTEKSSMQSTQPPRDNVNDGSDVENSNSNSNNNNHHHHDTMSFSLPDNCTTVLNDSQASSSSASSSSSSSSPTECYRPSCSHLYFHIPDVKRSRSDTDLLHLSKDCNTTTLMRNEIAHSNDHTTITTSASTNPTTAMTTTITTATTITNTTTTTTTTTTACIPADRDLHSSSYNILGFHNNNHRANNNDYNTKNNNSNRCIVESSSSSGSSSSSSSSPDSSTATASAVAKASVGLLMSSSSINNQHYNTDALSTNTDSWGVNSSTSSSPSRNPSPSSAIPDNNTSIPADNESSAVPPVGEATTTAIVTTTAPRRRSSISDMLKLATGNPFSSSSFSAKKRDPSNYQSTIVTNTTNNRATTTTTADGRCRSATTAATVSVATVTQQALPTVELNRLIIFDLQAYPLDLLSRCHVQQFENASSTVIKVKWFLLTRENVTGKPKTKGGERVPLPADQFGDRFGDAFGQALVTNNSMNIATILLTSAAVKTFTTRNTYF